MFICIRNISLTASIPVNVPIQLLPPFFGCFFTSRTSTWHDSTTTHGEAFLKKTKPLRIFCLTLGSL